MLRPLHLRQWHLCWCDGWRGRWHGRLDRAVDETGTVAMTQRLEDRRGFTEAEREEKTQTRVGIHLTPKIPSKQHVQTFPAEMVPTTLSRE